jgi:hypothetical protein
MTSATGKTTNWPAGSLYYSTSLSLCRSYLCHHYGSLVCCVGCGSLPGFRHFLRQCRSDWLLLTSTTYAFSGGSSASTLPPSLSHRPSWLLATPEPSASTPRPRSTASLCVPAATTLPLSLVAQWFRAQRLHSMGRIIQHHQCQLVPHWHQHQLHHRQRSTIGVELLDVAAR